MRNLNFTIVNQHYLVVDKTINDVVRVYDRDSFYLVETKSGVNTIISKEDIVGELSYDS